MSMHIEPTPAPLKVSLSKHTHRVVITPKGRVMFQANIEGEWVTSMTYEPDDNTPREIIIGYAEAIR